jgi:nucleotide-binding universal stress UspA family protein
MAETIVVGVDGSPGSDEAVRFAAREAALRDAVLRMVTVWHVPTAAYGGVGVAVVDPGDEYEQEAERCADEAAERFADELAGIAVEKVVREGGAARVLVEESEEAELLVVGSRGHGGFVGLLVGSVSGACAHHAGCPVVIVPSES